MDGIFVSYRRSDSQGEAGRLFDDLVPIFGEKALFMDVSAIEAGRDFRKAIDAGVSHCGVLLAVVGPEWLNAKDEGGASRLENPADFVRIETASALKRDIPVIPVLVRGAKMPSAEQLPDDLKELAYRNCIELTHARWKSDMQLLVDALRRLLGEGSQAAKEAAPAQVAAAPEAKSSTPLDPAAVQRVRRELAPYIGQIADIVVTRAASGCTSIDDLYLKVAEEIDSPGERETFLRCRTGALLTPLPKVPSPGDAQPGTLSSTRSHRWFLVLGGLIFLIVALGIGLRFARSNQKLPQPVAVPSQETPSEDSAAPATGVNSAPAATSAKHPDAGRAPTASAPGESASPRPAPSEPASPAPSQPTPSAPDQPQPPQRVTLPEEISRNLILAKVLPAYPILARQAHIQGMVVLDADISQDGTVESLRAISGHPMLIPAAVEAAKQFHYKPYVVNGQPAPVNTRIVVKFALSGG